MTLNPLNESSAHRSSGTWKEKLSKAASSNALLSPGPKRKSQIFGSKLSKRQLVKRLSHQIDDDYLLKIGICEDEKDSVDPKLLQQIKILNSDLIKEKIKNRETNESLAMLSKTMIKKLSDAETLHLEEMNAVETKCRKLEECVTNLEESKMQLLIESNKMIETMREHIKTLSKRLESYDQ